MDPINDDVIVTPNTEEKKEENTEVETPATADEAAAE